MDSTVRIIHDEMYHWVPEKNRYMVRLSAIKALMPKGEGFNRWLANQGGYDNAERVRDEAATSGTEIHTACVRLMLGEVLKYRQFPPDQWQKLVGFRNFWLENRPKLLIPPE